MKSDVIPVSGGVDRIEDALVQAEKVAVYQELSPRSALHLRLMTEEMMSMVRAIAGEVNGDFWIENNARQFELHLSAVMPLDYRKREELLSASASGMNEAHRGFMGKIRAFFEPLEGVPVYFGVVPSGTDTEMLTWSMSTYQQQVRRSMEQNQAGAEEAWDELEKSVIAHVADDVKVWINGYKVEMIVYKKLD